MLPSDLDELIGGVLGEAVLELLRQRLVKNVPVADPAAGADWSVTVPAGVTWELLSFHTRLATSAAVANRFPSWLVKDPDGNEWQRIVQFSAATAGQTEAISGVSGFGDHVTGGTTIMPMQTPPIVMPSGHKLVGGTSSIDVADQYSQTIVTVREWSIQQVQRNLDTISGWIR